MVGHTNRDRGISTATDTFATDAAATSDIVPRPSPANRLDTIRSLYGVELIVKVNKSDGHVIGEP